MAYIIKNKIIGEGAQGIIKTAYKETDPNTEYAVKIFPYMMRGENLRIGLRNDGYGEIALNQILIHPNIIQMVDFMIDDNNMYLIMELADNDLYQYMENYNLTIDQKIKYISQIGSALSYLQKNNLMHCDLKLDNILIKNDNAVLSDFGISLPFDMMRSTCHALIYRAPELIFNEIPIKGSAYEPFYKSEVTFTKIADIWAYGIICLEILYGKRFRQSLDLVIIRDEVPEQYRTPTMDNIGGYRDPNYFVSTLLVHYISYLAYFYDIGTYQNLINIMGPLQTEKENELLSCIARLLDVNYDTRIKNFDEFLSFDIFPSLNNGFQKLLLPVNLYQQLTPNYNNIFRNLLQRCIEDNIAPIIFISTVDFILQNHHFTDLYIISVFWLFSSIYLTRKVTIRYCEKIVNHSGADIMKSIIDIITEKNGKILCDTIYNYLPSALTTAIALILMTDYIELYSKAQYPELMALKIIKNINNDPLLPKNSQNIYDNLKNPEISLYVDKILDQLK
jgi:serine/threonine protein kinase